MTAYTKRKYVRAELLYATIDELQPDLSKGERIARIGKPRGNHLHAAEVQNDQNCLEHFLVSMPRKFRNYVYVKRGSFVKITPIAEGNKVKGEIVRIFLPKQVEKLQTLPCWPTLFEKSIEVDDGEDRRNYDYLKPNPNRPYDYVTSSSEEEDEDEEEEASSSEEVEKQASSSEEDASSSEEDEDEAASSSEEDEDEEASSSEEDEDEDEEASSSEEEDDEKTSSSEEEIDDPENDEENMSDSEKMWRRIYIPLRMRSRWLRRAR